MGNKKQQVATLSLKISATSQEIDRVICDLKNGRFPYRIVSIDKKHQNTCRNGVKKYRQHLHAVRKEDKNEYD